MTVPAPTRPGLTAEHLPFLASLLTVADQAGVTVTYYCFNYDWSVMTSPVLDDDAGAAFLAALDDDCWDYAQHVEVPDSWPASSRGLEAGRHYAPTADTKTLGGFHMSYGGYNRWRESLSLAVLGVMPSDVWADLAPYRDRPFYEVVNFTDCEGVISAAAAADLLADFREYRDTYRAHVTQVEREDLADWWSGAYDQFTEILALATDGGLIEYH